LRFANYVINEYTPVRMLLMMILEFRVISQIWEGYTNEDRPSDRTVAHVYLLYIFYFIFLATSMQWTTLLLFI